MARVPGGGERRTEDGGGGGLGSGLGKMTYYVEQEFGSFQGADDSKDTENHHHDSNNDHS